MWRFSITIGSNPNIGLFYSRRLRMLTLKQIQNHETPYQLLTADNNLLEHCELLHTLEQPAMKDLALKIVNQCDWNSIENLIGTITTVQEQYKVKNDFLEILNLIVQIKRHFAEVLLSTNNQYSHLLGNVELCERTFQGYQKESLTIIQGKEEDLAKNLAKSTPAEHRSQLATNMNILFPKSVLVTKINETFTLTRNIERFLLGKNPALFFTNGDFSAAMCTQYRDLLSYFLKCQSNEVEATIAALLDADADAESTQAQHNKANKVLTNCKDTHFCKKILTYKLDNSTLYGNYFYTLFNGTTEDTAPPPISSTTVNLNKT